MSSTSSTISLTHPAGLIDDTWEDGYVAVSWNFAQATARTVGEAESPTILLHDYQLYMVPLFLLNILGRRFYLTLRTYYLARTGLPARVAELHEGGHPGKSAGGERDCFPCLEPRPQLRRDYDVVPRHGKDPWTPIKLSMEDNFPRSVATYKNYDVLLVNATWDGITPVAKEATVVNERDGILVLSENAGAFEELGDHALTSQPLRFRRAGRHHLQSTHHARG